MGMCEKVVKECARWVKSEPAEEVDALPCERDVARRVERAKRDVAVAGVDAKYQRLDMGFLGWSIDTAPPARTVCIVGMVVEVLILVVPLVLAVAMRDGYVLGWMALGILGVLPYLYWKIEHNEVALRHIPQFACFDAFGNGECVYDGWESGLKIVDEYLPKLGGRSYSCTMRGAIPEEVREKIRAAREDFSKVIIVAEMAPNAWTVRRADRDPLIVGYKDGAFWLVGWFNLTKVEDYVLGTRVS